MVDTQPAGETVKLSCQLFLGLEMIRDRYSGSPEVGSVRRRNMLFRGSARPTSLADPLLRACSPSS
jgi:hypothetical protein